jgi:hypothetical protein
VAWELLDVIREYRQWTFDQVHGQSLARQLALASSCKLARGYFIAAARTPLSCVPRGSFAKIYVIKMQRPI